MNKKAQGISLETIIVAIIVIVVLVILVLIFTGRMGNFVNTSNACTVRGGNCVSGTVCGDNQREVVGGICSKKDGEPAQVCCIGIPTS